MKDPPNANRHRRKAPRPMIHQRADELSDEELVSRLLDTQELDSALSELYDRYSRTVYGVGMKILGGGDRSLAEELVQDVFLKVWRSSKTFDASRASFSTWLYKVTRSVAMDLYRKRASYTTDTSYTTDANDYNSITTNTNTNKKKKKKKVHTIDEGESYIARARDTSHSPQELVEESWLSWRISRAMEALEEGQREVIELAYFGGLSQREISRRTGIPLGTVKSRTASALRSLRTELAPEETWQEIVR